MLDLDRTTSSENLRKLRAFVKMNEFVVKCTENILSTRDLFGVSVCVRIFCGYRLFVVQRFCQCFCGDYLSIMFYFGM